MSILKINVFSRLQVQLSTTVLYKPLYMAQKSLKNSGHDIYFFQPKDW